MADALGGLGSYIFNQNDPNVNQQLRQRIALAMIAKQRRYPKTFGEGLSAIGDSLGEIGMARRLEQGDLAAQSADKKLEAADTGYAGNPSSPPPAIQPSATPPAASAPAMSEAASPGTPAVSDNRGLLAAPPPKKPSLTDLPTGEPGDIGATTFPPPYQPTPAPAPAPSMGSPGGDDPRRAVALQMLKQGNLGQPQSPAFAPKSTMPGMSEGQPALPEVPEVPGPAAGQAPGEDPRRAIALGMLRQGNLGQPQNPNFAPSALGQVPGAPPMAAGDQPPVVAFDGQPSKAPGMPPMPLPAAPQQQIRQAPPMEAPIAQAPQAAPQAGPQPVPPAATQPKPVPGYVPPPPQGSEPAVPGKTPYSPIETKAMLELNEAKRTGNQYTMDRAGRILAQEAEKRQYLDARNLEVYKEKLKERNEAQRLHETARETQQSRLTGDQKAQAELVGAQTEASIVQRTGMKPSELLPRLDKDKEVVDSAIKSQSAQALARKAIADGVITGYGANMRIAADKFSAWALKNGMSNDLAANTEIMKAALSTGLSDAIKTINGNGGQVSNSDVKIAQSMSGVDPNLQMKTIKALMDKAAEINFRTINRYEDYVQKTLGGTPLELQYRSTHGPTAPPEKIAMLYQSQADPQKALVYRKYFDEIYGPGAAELELGRVQRLAQRRAMGAQ